MDSRRPLSTASRPPSGPIEPGAPDSSSDLRFDVRGVGKLLGALIGVAFLGFAAKLYDGPGAGWLNDSLAGLFYVVFWCLAAAICLPYSRPERLAIAVLVATCSLEVLQLWHPPLLARVRETFVGQTLLGTTFQGSDFIYYSLGAILGWASVRWLRPLRARK